MSSLAQLLQHGQSCWMDDLTRHMIESGSLARRVGEEGLRGITSNPTIFAEAIERGDGYAREIADAAARRETPKQVYEDLIVSDIQNACDVLRSVYEGTQGTDGFASLEVSPHLAHDTEGSIEEACRLWRRVDRPNLFIKIPGTAAGVPAIEQLLFDGININITLLFSVARFEAVAEAYMRALERRLAANRPIEGVASVASFFLSRIDVLVDELLEQRIAPGRPSAKPDPKALLGKAGIANAKLAYRKFRQNLASARWQVLARRGAGVQRVLWASTSTKNPHYPDLMYVEPLIGPFTINTMPQKTIAAFEDHGRIADDTVEQGVREAERVMADLERVGVAFDLVTTQLENEGVQKFIKAYDGLLGRLANQTGSAGVK
jgi:transaldolase